MMRFNNRKAKWIVTAVLVIALLIAVGCGNSGDDEADSDNKNGNIVQDDETTNKTPEEIINEVILPDDQYKVHYYAQWEMEIDFPYDKVDDYWEEMTDIGYFKFFYDQNDQIVQHIRYQEGRPARIAFYNHLDDGGKEIQWTKNYDYKTGKPNGYDFLTYYPSGRIKSLTEYKVNENGDEEVLMKIEYNQIQTKEGKPQNIVRYYNSEGKEMMYAENEYQENNYTDYPQYLKAKKTMYVAFGEFKDKWFSIIRYNDAGEIIQTQENEMEAEEGLIIPDYMAREFPEYFSGYNSQP